MGNFICCTCLDQSLPGDLGGRGEGIYLGEKRQTISKQEIHVQLYRRFRMSLLLTPAEPSAAMLMYVEITEGFGWSGRVSTVFSSLFKLVHSRSGKLTLRCCVGCEPVLRARASFASGLGQGSHGGCCLVGQGSWWLPHFPFSPCSVIIFLPVIFVSSIYSFWGS